MPEKIIINTGPILAIIAATGELNVLRDLYREVLVPYEVQCEIEVGGPSSFGVQEFTHAGWLRRMPAPIEIQPLLRNSLDAGEASVIQLALAEGIETVCIDEAAGRRVARLSGLLVTGSLGILLRAQRQGHQIVLWDAIQRMRAHGVWLSDKVVEFVLEHSVER